jgi:hypothetical protein
LAIIEATAMIAALARLALFALCLCVMADFDFLLLSTAVSSRCSSVMTNSRNLSLLRRLMCSFSISNCRMRAIIRSLSLWGLSPKMESSSSSFFFCFFVSSSLDESSKDSFPGAFPGGSGGFVEGPGGFPGGLGVTFFGGSPPVASAFLVFSSSEFVIFFARRPEVGLAIPTLLLRSDRLSADLSRIRLICACRSPGVRKANLVLPVPLSESESSDLTTALTLAVLKGYLSMSKSGSFVYLSASCATDTAWDRAREN